MGYLSYREQTTNQSFYPIIINMDFDLQGELDWYLPHLTGGPRNELRNMEKKCVVASLVRSYQLDDKAKQSAIRVILNLRRVEGPMANERLVKFLFENSHSRWREYISMLNDYGHLAVPLLKAILRSNDSNDIMSHWSGLLQIIYDRTAIHGIQEFDADDDE